jgi:hypothetical protein
MGRLVITITLPSSNGAMDQLRSLAALVLSRAAALR